MADLQCPENANMSLTQHSSTNLKNEIHISTVSTHYYVLLRISTHYAWSPSGTTYRLRTSLMILDVFSCVNEAEILARKVGGCIVRTALAVAALSSPPQRVRGIVQELQRGRHMSFWILHTFRRVGTYSCASIIKNQAAKCLMFGSCNNHIITH